MISSPRRRSCRRSRESSRSSCWPRSARRTTTASGSRWSSPTATPMRATTRHPDHVRFVQERWVPEVRDFLELDYAVRSDTRPPAACAAVASVDRPSPLRSSAIASSISTQLALSELEVRAGQPAVDVARQAGADDRSGDARLGQRPGDRESRQRRPQPLGQRTEALDEREIAAEQRLGEERGVTAPVVRIEVGDPLGVEGARQQPRAHRRIDEHARRRAPPPTA